MGEQRRGGRKEGKGLKSIFGLDAVTYSVGLLGASSDINKNRRLLFDLKGYFRTSRRISPKQNPGFRVTTVFSEMLLLPKVGLGTDRLLTLCFPSLCCVQKQK